MGSGVWLALGALLCLGAGVLLFTGRGAWLVAGYNSMTPERRARYDERKLCRATGSMLLGVSLACGLMGCAAVLEGDTAGACEVSDCLDLLAAVILIADIVLGVWYANTKCYRA